MNASLTVTASGETRPVELYRRGGRGGAYVFDPQQAPWQAAGREGIVQKVIRRDDARGHFLGLIGMEPMTRSGLHQHQGVATSFFVDGGLTDYQGTVAREQMGINLKGATHDAISYPRSLFVARLQAPVTYPPDSGPLHQLHAGARHALMVNPAPAVPPDINVTVDALPMRVTGCDGVLRQSVFDYAGTPEDHRLVQLQLRPQVAMPRLLVTDQTEIWVRGGLLEVDGQVAAAGSFVILEPGIEVSLASPFGALLIVWAEGPAHWVDSPAALDAAAMRADLFGYR